MHTIVILAGRKVLKELRPKLAGSLKLSTYNRRKIWQKEKRGPHRADRDTAKNVSKKSRKCLEVPEKDNNKNYRRVPTSNQ